MEAQEQKITCPKCGAKEENAKGIEGTQDGSIMNFGFPPVCAGEAGVHATCYTCETIFELPKSEQQKGK